MDDDDDDDDGCGGWIVGLGRIPTLTDSHVPACVVRCRQQVPHLQSIMMILRYIRHKHSASQPAVHLLGRGSSP